jgi:DNA-binding transcriptional MerR regulator
LVRPSAADATGSGSRREYTYRDLLELKVIKKLLDAGIRLESIRDVFAYMREHVDTDISAAHLVISGSSVILCDGDELIDVLRHGQGVLNVLPMSGVRDEVDRRIIAFAPAAQEPDVEVVTKSDDDEEGGTAAVVAV